MTRPAHKPDYRRKQKWLLVPHECPTKRLFFNQSSVGVFVSFCPLEMLWAIHVSEPLWLALLVPSNLRSILRKVIFTNFFFFFLIYYLFFCFFFPLNRILNVFGSGSGLDSFPRHWPLFWFPLSHSEPSPESILSKPSLYVVTVVLLSLQSTTAWGTEGNQTLNNNRIARGPSWKECHGQDIVLPNSSSVTRARPRKTEVSRWSHVIKIFLSMWPS